MSKKLFAVLGLLVVISMLLVACGGAEPVATEEPAAEEPAAEEPAAEEPVAEEPTEEPAPTEEPVVRTTRVGGWLDTVAMSVVSSDSAVTQIEAGAVDLYASNLSTPADFAAIEAAGLKRSTQFGLYYEITLNPSGPVFEGTGKLNPFASMKMREALNWLIDREYISQEIYGGTAIPKWLPFVAGFPDYARNIEVIKPLEVKYAYNPEKASEVFTTEMEAMGATMVDGKWTYEGEPVVLKFLIRTDSDGTRRPMGDIISNWLEDEGFTVDRVYGTSSELSPFWIGGNPNDGEWNLYTGAWGIGGIPRNDGDNFQFFYTPGSAYGSVPLWQAYTDVTPEYQQLSDDLANNNYTTLEQRTAMFSEALPTTMELSYRVWVVDGVGASAWRPDMTVSYDLAAGVDINQLWPYTLRFVDQEGGLTKWSDPDLFVDPANPIGGSNWTYDSQWIIGTQDTGTLPNPFTGILLPQRLERAEVTVETGLPVSKTYDWVDLSFEDTVTVPEDALIDWDPANQVWVTVGEAYPDGLTAKVKSVTYYPDLSNYVWHDGSSISAADFMMGMIMTFEPGTEGSAIYDEAAAPNLDSFKAAFKGFRFVSTDPMVVEYYTDVWQLDAENNVVSLFPTYTYGGSHPWHLFAVANLAEANGELAYSSDKADASEIEWMNWIGGPSLEILSAKLDEAIASSLIPYEPTMGQYVTAEDAAARYANLKAFYEDHGHFWVGSGPYILDEVRLVEKTATLVHNPNFPDLADKWNIFSEPKLAEIAVDGPGRVSAGEEGTFDVFVTYKGEAYPAEEIDQVKYLLFGPDNSLVESGAAEFVADGQYMVTLSTDTTGAFTSGAYKLTVVVVAIPVAIPSFGDFEFVSE